MALAGMINLDQDALRCDLAETYHIYDLEGLPVKLLATLSVGLRDDSRIKMQMRGDKAPPEILMMAAILDGINILLWAKTKDGAKGIHRPESVFEKLIKKEDHKKHHGLSLTSDEFLEKYNEILKGG